MADREKVINGLRCLSDAYDTKNCDKCGYEFTSCVLDVSNDALQLLKEQEPKPRVLTLEEAIETLTKEGGFVWIEEKSHPCEKSKVFATSYLCESRSRRYEDYGKKFVPYKYSYRWLWRCWDAFPNNEQREAVKWDETY